MDSVSVFARFDWLLKLGIASVIHLTTFSCAIFPSFLKKGTIWCWQSTGFIYTKTIAQFRYVKIRICNRMRPSRIKDKFSRVFSRFSQIVLVAARLGQFCENFENTSEIYP